MPRLFFAVWPSASERKLVADYARAALGTVGKQVREPDFHITLNFLGQVSSQAGQTALAIEPPDLAPFGIHLGPAHMWPRGLVVLEAASAELASLQSEIDARLRSLGLPTEDRAFRPHVTLARNAQGVVLPPFPPVTWNVDSFCLVSSAPSSQSKYTVLRRWPAH